MNYFVGSQAYFDGLPILPTIDTTNGGIKLNSDISMAVGAKVEFDGLRLNEAVYETRRRLIDSRTGDEPRVFGYVNENTSSLTGGVLPTGSASWAVTTVSTTYVPNTFAVTSGTGNFGELFVRNGAQFGRCRSKGIRVKDASGNTVWQWLTKVSDYKTTPPSGAIIGTIVWGKAGIEANYLTAAAFTAAVTTATEPVTVILEPGASSAGIPTTISGYPVTVVEWGKGAQTWLCGSVAGYYSYPGVPYLSFDGTDDSVTVANSTIVSLIGGSTASTGYAVEVDTILGQDGTETSGEMNMAAWYMLYGATHYQIRYKSGAVYDLFTKATYADGQYHKLKVEWLPATTKYRVSVDGVVVGTTPTGAEPVSNTALSVMATAGAYRKGPVRGLKIYNAAGNVVASYINFGTQNSGTSVPSNPAGYNGTRFGAAWMYEGVARHDETAALTLAALNATTLTGPVMIVDLDGAIPAGYLPTTKDGWPISMINYPLAIATDTD